MKKQKRLGWVTAMALVTVLSPSPSRGADSPPTTAPSVVGDPDIFGSRLSGGTRSEGDPPGVFLLLPQTPAKTAQAHPTIYWYLDKPTEADQVLVVSKLQPRDGSSDIKSYTAMPFIRGVLRGHHDAGMQSFDLSSQPVELVNGTYKVTVSVRIDRANAAANPFSTGLLRKVDSAAASDLWFDRVSQLCQTIGKHPDDTNAHSQRRELLASQHVFLTFSAPDDIASIKGQEHQLIEKSAKKSADDEKRILDLLDPISANTAPK